MALPGRRDRGTVRVLRGARRCSSGRRGRDDARARAVRQRPRASDPRALRREPPRHSAGAALPGPRSAGAGSGGGEARLGWHAGGPWHRFHHARRRQCVRRRRRAPAASREVEPTLLVIADDGMGAGSAAPRRPEREDTLRVFGLYLAGLANDLRGPLTAFLGHLTLLTKRSDLPGDLREAFELYRQVTSETLDRFGRAMEWGRRVPLVERVDPETVVTAAVATFETESTPGTVCLELDLAPTAAVVGNADQIQLAIEHVVRNAWESFGGRDGTISITLEPRGRQVALVVKDNGPGIPDSILPHGFEAFSSTKSISAGLGLGLAIVKDIVDRHQGQVTIDSSSAGTTVTFLFDGVDEAVGDGQRATRKRVLLVEDNVAVHETYRLLLEKSGFEVVC